ncbi:MAG: phosphoribosylformylglycinamidine synthase [Gammaproteobacteria bacterium]
MLILRGGTAATPFRLQQQLNSVQKIAPGIESIESHWIYFTENSGVLPSDQIGTLRQLLSVKQAISTTYKLDEQFIVSPRIGTISPWSSKATDIVDHSGLGMTGRVERGVLFSLVGWRKLDADARQQVFLLLHDRMTQSILTQVAQASLLFQQKEPAPVRRLVSIEEMADDIAQYNVELGLALSDDEIEYLVENYTKLERCPSDVELMMFAQANSEHCRHKIFNASWTIDGKKEGETLFGMIRTTHANAPHNVLSAYKDNSAVIAGHAGERFYAHADTSYSYSTEDIHILMKVETHNHPTAISPFPGAATGSGGEIRDEGATGRGGYPKAGLCGFTVSNLQIPGMHEPWEGNYGKPDRIVSALDIMIEGPIGAAAFNNEFGRPNLLGYFRTFEQEIDGVVRGYHKPIMIAGGMGNIRASDVQKLDIPAGTPIIVLGGPAMLIGLGGGAASSMASGSSNEQLDFASVQRENPEMERRCQEVINRCWGLQDDNPVLSVHDVGAGGLSNALPEILNDVDRGGIIELRKVPNAEPGMSPMEIWCNEAQERYVLAIEVDHLDAFRRICERERCPYAVVGEATEKQDLIVTDAKFAQNPIDIPMEVLLGKPPKVERDTTRKAQSQKTADYSHIKTQQAIEYVLRNPTVASKKFLISIGDRTITGLVARDQMVGPWQVPVADVAVTASSFKAYTGEAMSIGERAPIAVSSGPSSARMSVAEAITNLLAADVQNLHDIRLSANWMAAANYSNEDSVLFDTVNSLSSTCRELNIAIPVGKDSLSMQTQWQEAGVDKHVVSPVSLIVTAFTPVSDIRKTWTPQIRTDLGTSYLVLIDLGEKKNRLGASCLSQVYKIDDDNVPDLNSSDLLIRYFNYINKLRDEINVISYHDRSDGGLLATLCEMAFAGRCGMKVQVNTLGDSELSNLFNEELGAVFQVTAEDLGQATLLAEEYGLSDCFHILGEPRPDENIIITHNDSELLNKPRAELELIWSQPSIQIQKLRDNPESAEQESRLISESNHKGLISRISFDINDDITAPYIVKGLSPKVAILREQGVNGQIEMAAAFDRAGFEAIDVHMTDLVSGRRKLSEFQMLAACGGFSYGDVLGAGNGWASSILYNSELKDQFNMFFNRPEVLALGVCNGCQMMSNLSEIIPGSELWPKFVRNTSEQFEARLVNVKITNSPSLMFSDMKGSVMPVAVAHGEGRIDVDETHCARLVSANLNVMHYVNSSSEATEIYPLNPNGSHQGITAFTNKDGRFTIMMPHPERLFRAAQHSWHPDDWEEDSPWMRMFRNARVALN